MILSSRFQAVLVTLAITIFASHRRLKAQPSDPVLNELTKKYALTRVDPDGTVTQPGTIVSVGQHLLRANPIYGDRYQPNTYKKGRVTQPTIMKPSRDNIKLADSLDYISFNEKVYITKIDVTDSDVVFRLQACAASLSHTVSGAIYRASLSFQFPKASVNIGNIDQIQRTIAEVFIVVGSGEISGGSGPPNTPSYVDRPRPTQATPASATQDIVHVGQTVDEVKALLGQPDRVENFGSRIVYSYSGLKVTFVDGKVNGVQQ